MRKTSEKAESFSVQDQKGKTINKGRTGDTGFVTSLRVQDEKHLCGKGSNLKEKQAGGRQQPRSDEDLFQGTEKTGPPSPHPQLTGSKNSWMSCLAQDTH